MTLIWGGLALGAVYALVAIGYNIVFISSKTFNFAQAQLMMIGAFVAYSGLVTWDLPWPVVLLVAALVVGLAAAIEERIAIRPVKDMHNDLVTTLGASIFLDGVAQLTWGSQPLTVPFFAGDEAITLLGGRGLPRGDRPHPARRRAGRGPDAVQPAVPDRTRRCSACPRTGRRLSCGASTCASSPSPPSWSRG